MRRCGMSDELRIKFWGVRGSYPAPGVGTVKYGGNTASVEVQAGERTILLDAGTGIIPLGRELARSKRAGEIMVLFSHLHHDHTQGFPFFIPAYLPNVRLYISVRMVHTSRWHMYWSTINQRRHQLSA